MGDTVYGAGFKASASRLGAEAQAALTALGRQALHAAELGFEHTLTRRRLRFSSPLPDDIRRLHEALRDSDSRARPPARTPRNAKRT
jgi:23S rRNA pseudouridine1911/1915/1917 synthase